MFFYLPAPYSHKESWVSQQKRKTEKALKTARGEGPKEASPRSHLGKNNFAGIAGINPVAKRTPFRVRSTQDPWERPAKVRSPVFPPGEEGQVECGRRRGPPRPRMAWGPKWSHNFDTATILYALFMCFFLSYVRTRGNRAVPPFIL